ncbi:FtsX-like permease family protein [Actinopolymorpha alba]|uniref:FtsX-like permease family protein n=1 Tax=Actinopolymorpha alba TaxID=533267 RepID=UPI00035D68D1|nr:FtsX-like permease family protein [Actinopolymorpha alba]
MTPAIHLGLRLAAGTGRTERLRAGLTVGAAALGTLVFVTALAVVHAESRRTGGELDRDHQILLATVLAVLGMPVLTLLASITRLSASVRDRRLAALRLLGLSPTRTRTVAATEASALALVGAALGCALCFGLRPLVERVTIADRQWQVADFLPPWWQLGAVVVGVPLLAVVVALAPTRAVTARPLAVRRGAGARRPSLLRLLPVLAGAAGMAWMFTLPQDPEASLGWSEFWPFLVGAILAGVGLPLAVPVLVRTAADLLARVAQRQAVLVAARRLQVEPSATTRIVAGLLLTLFLVTGARCVITAWERTPQYLEAYRAAYTGPQVISLHADPSSPQAGTDLRPLGEEPFVRKVVPANIVTTRCDGPRSLCGTVYVGTCAELAQLLPVKGCRDDRVAWISHPDDRDTSPSRIAPGTPLTIAREVTSQAVEIPAPSARITSSTDVTWSDARVLGLFVPRDFPGAAALADPAHRTWVVYAEPGKKAHDAVIGAIERLAPTTFAYDMADYATLEQVGGYLSILWAVTAVIVLVGLTSFGITAIDRAVERRRQVASLHVLGAPAKLARRSQLLQALIPLGLGIPLAGGLGMLAGSGYLAFGSLRDDAPWQSVLAVVAAAMTAALLVAAASVPAIGRGVKPDLLRRE